MEKLPTAIGRYLIREFIARGGMGTVYLAVDPHLERQVAIKLLREADNEDLRARFTREARSAANLRHRNIVTIFDVGEHERLPFIAMEYIHGQTLGQVISSDAPMSTVRKLQLIEGLCEGLSYAHARGVVHRDIKPANLMIDGDQVLKILDFGIARAMADAGFTQAGFLVGTLNYMSPEQVAGKSIDGRSDMFAVGAVLYELLTRQQAFPGSLENGLLNKILNQEPANFDKVCAGFDPAISAIIRRCLEKDPNKRFVDLRTMAAEIDSVRQRLDAAARAAAARDTSLTTEVSFPDVSPTVVRPPRKETDRQELARRRVTLIEERLNAARHALDSRDFDAAVSSCEEALLIDPDEPRVGDLLRRAREGRDQVQADELIREAQDRLRDGDLTSASNYAREALALVPESPAAIDLARVIGEARVERDRRRQRAEALLAILSRARAAFDKGDFEGAIIAAAEALDADSNSTDALDLRRRAELAIAERERQALDLKAGRAAAEARDLFSAGRHADALALLEEFWPAHKVVSQLWMELSTDVDRLAREQQAKDDEIENVDRPQPAIAPVSPPTGARVGNASSDAGPRTQSVPATVLAGRPETPSSSPGPVPSSRRSVSVSPPPPSGPAASSPAKVPVSSHGKYYGAGLAAVLVVGGAAAFVLMRGTSQEQKPISTSTTKAVEGPPSTPPKNTLPEQPPPAAPADAPIEQQVASLRTRIRSYISMADYRDALSPTITALQLRPNDSEFVEAARQIETVARRDAISARDAVRSHASPPASLRYAEANRQLDQGQKLARSGQKEDAIHSYWKAQDLFREAAGALPAPPVNTGEAKTIAPNIAPPAQPPAPVSIPPAVVDPAPRQVVASAASTPPPSAPTASTPAPSTTPASTPSAQLTSPAPVPTSPPAASSTPPASPAVTPPPRINEEPAIRAALEAYAQGFRTLNAEAVARVFPSVDVGKLRQSFQEARQQDLQIENLQVRVDGASATVLCQVRQRFTPRAGQAQERVMPVVFVLNKANGSWVIASRR